MSFETRGWNALAALALVALLAPAAGATLDRYFIRDFSIADFQASQPKTFLVAPEPGGFSAQPDASTLPPPTADDIAIVDRTGPTLRKLIFRVVSGGGQTTFVGAFNGFIWFAGAPGREGPIGTFTATAGSLGSANTGTVSWPVLTGYFVTGATFCNSNPSFICSLAVGSNLQTVDPDLRSSFYDVGPWEFHGTGFTGNPFVFFTSTLPGNSSIVIKGATAPNATVPALPLLGVAALSASLVAMGVAVLRRTRS